MFLFKKAPYKGGRHGGFGEEYKRVGLCFVGLLPDVYNEKFSRSLLRSTR